MDNQVINVIAFAGFFGFVSGVVLTWIVARMVLSSRGETVRDHIGSSGIAALRRLADAQARNAQTLVEANKLAQSASADLAKAADLVRQAEGVVRSSTEQLGSMTGGASGPTNLESEPLKPRAARA